MTVMQESIDWDGVALMEQVCATLEISPPPVKQWVDELDFDPDPILAQLDSLTAASRSLTNASGSLDRAVPGVWEGQAAENVEAAAECQRTYWEQIGDFLLWLVENIVQLLDYIVDLLRIVVTWITFLVSAFAIVSGALGIVSASVGDIGIASVLGALISSALLAVTGAIALVGVLISGVLWLLDKLFEWLEQVVQDARGSMYGEGLSTLPDGEARDREPPIFAS